MFKAACETDKRSGLQPGADCYWYGIYLLKSKDTVTRDKGESAITRACQMGYGTACYDLSQQQLINPKPNLDEYLRLLDLACKNGSPDACQELKTPDRDLKRACQEGVMIYCELLRKRESINKTNKQKKWTGKQRYKNYHEGKTGTK